MNPDYFKTKEKKLYKHEMDRVKKMTDRELYTRYARMGKQDKIQAFYEVLTDELRVPKLREKMEGNNGISAKTRKKTRKKTVKKASTGNSKPLHVYALRSDYDHDESGVWVKVFMCYNGNTVMMVEFENGELVNTEHYTYAEAKEYWNKQVSSRVNMHRDDSYIEGLELGDVRI